MEDGDPLDERQAEELGIRLDWPEDPLEVALPTTTEPDAAERLPEEHEFESDDAGILHAPSTSPPPMSVTPPVEAAPPAFGPQPIVAAPPPVDLTPLMARLDALIDTSMAF